MQQRNKVIGVFSHVDAGKTTLIEALLYQAQVITAVGNVNKGTTFMDNEPIERQRGITFSSKPVHFEHHGQGYTIIDTPGHMDLTFEMEKSLQVVDVAILLISATDGITGYTETIFNLCQEYGVPVIFFYNKMDMITTAPAELCLNLEKLSAPVVPFTVTSDGVVDWSNETTFLEDWAVLDEDWFSYLMADEEGGVITSETITDKLNTALLARTIMPVIFGSARQQTGISALLAILDVITLTTEPSDYAVAQVYKITHDQKNNRYVHAKVIKGVFQPKDKITTDGDDEQKINQLFNFQGGAYQAVNRAQPGDIVAVTGIDVQPGHFFGTVGIADDELPQPVSLKREAILAVRVLTNDVTQNDLMIKNMQSLAQEDPTLHVQFKANMQELYIHVTGPLQMEYLKVVFANRFGFEIEFSAPTILYKETITQASIGYGHYEPLRHYAEVALRLSPGQPGQGIIFENECSREQLPINYQKRIEQHVFEKAHLGVLTGAPMTDVTVTLLSGQAYVPETKGGDFREATNRAIRQALMKTNNQLLEPWYTVTAVVPAHLVGRVSADLEKMNGHIDNLISGSNDTVTVIGAVPVANFFAYPTIFASFSKNVGRLSTKLQGYQPCKDQAELIAAAAYDPESDLDNTANSIFFKKGHGFDVYWRDVDDLHHINLV